MTAVALTATLGLAAASWVVAVRQMNGMDMGVATRLGSFSFFVAVWVSMMAAMMVPGAVPAVVRFAHASGRMRTAPLFVGSYLAVWTLVGLAVYALYRRHGPRRRHDCHRGWDLQVHAAVEYNFREMDLRPSAGDSTGLDEFASSLGGTNWETYRREGPGMSAFVIDDGIVYHTYSAYARGLDGLWGMYQWLDRAPLGRNETGFWWRRHDEYDGQ